VSRADSRTHGRTDQFCIREKVLANSEPSTHTRGIPDFDDGDDRCHCRLSVSQQIRRSRDNLDRTAAISVVGAPLYGPPVRRSRTQRRETDCQELRVHGVTRDGVLVLTEVLSTR
jgi:hypothetical protein